MKNKLVLVLLAFLIYAQACNFTKKLPAQKTFYFVQIADPQLGMFSKNKDFIYESTKFNIAIDKIIKLKPEFVIICGDLVNKTGDSAQLKEFKNITSKLTKSRITLYNLPGNHDVGNSPTQKSIDEYNRNFGKDFYSFVVANNRMIVLNSNLLTDTTLVYNLYQKQFQWLKDELSEAKKLKQPVYVFMHHLFFEHSFDEPIAYFNFNPQIRNIYLNLFAENNVQAIFSGHRHQNIVNKWKNIDLITTSSVGMPLGKDSSGIRIVKISNSGFQHKYYCLDSIPQKLEK